MSLKTFYMIGFFSLIACDTFSQVCFKMAALEAGPFMTNVEWLGRALVTPWVYGAIIGYLGAFITWMTLLRHAPIGPAFAASHLEVVGVMVISVTLFGEVLTPAQLFGALLIVAGVVCLAHSETQSHVQL